MVERLVLCCVIVVLAACGSSGSTPPVQAGASSSTRDGGSGGGGGDPIAIFEQTCVKDSTWAADHQKKTGKPAVVRVAVSQEEGMDTVVAESLRGRVENVLLDHGTVQVAASFGDLAKMQQLQMLSNEQPGTEQLGADFMVTVKVSEVVGPSPEGEVHDVTTAFRVVEVETSAMACVAMAKQRTTVVREPAAE